MENTKIDFKENAFDLLRILAAFQVMFGHIVEHLELEAGGNGIFHMLVRISQVIPGRGVIVFFAISGYLVIPSIEKSSFGYYCKKKFARIYPGLWFAFLVNTCMIAALYGLSQSMLDNLIYVVTQTTFLQFYTGDWLRGWGASTPNGSLWTISVLIQFYIAAYAFYKVCYHWNVRRWIAILVSMQFISIVVSNCGEFVPTIIYKLIGVSLLPYFHIFMWGMFIYRFREKILPWLEGHAWHLLAVYAAIKILLMNIRFPFAIGLNYDVISSGLLSLVTVGIAYRLGTVRFKTEISYGIFLWHMIFVNVAMEIIEANSGGAVWHLRCLAGAAVVVLSVLAARFSAIFVERPIQNRILRGSGRRDG